MLEASVPERRHRVVLVAAAARHIPEEDRDEVPELLLGDPEAARVLAESSAAGATYLDLRIPGRVAAGGLAPVTPEEENSNLQPEAENSPTLNG